MSADGTGRTLDGVDMSRRAVTRRAGWSVGDQVLSSLTNFVLTIVAVRLLSPSGFGAFAIAYTAALTLTQVSRAVCSEPLVVRASDLGATAWRRAARASTGAALVVGVAAACGLAAVGLAFAGDLRRALVAMAVGLPGLLVQDAWRYAFFARGEPRQAALNDLAWAGVQFPLLAVLAATGHATIVTISLAWGAAAAASAAVGSLQAGVLPAPGSTRAWLTEHRDLAPRYVGEFLLFRSSILLTSYAVGLVAGLAAAGSLTAAQTVFGPLAVIYLGARVVAVPEAVRALGRSRARFRSSIAVLAGGLGLAGLVWATVALAVPDAAGRALLGESWPAARALLVPVGITMAATGVSVAPWTGLRALEAAGASLRVRALLSPVMLGAGVAGALAGDAPGAAWGIAAGSVLSAAAWWLEYERALRARTSGRAALGERVRALTLRVDDLEQSLRSIV